MEMETTANEQKDEKTMIILLVKTKMKQTMKTWHE